MNPSRRQFLLNSGCALGAAAMLTQLRGLAAAPLAGSGDYRALVCCYLYGGNDGNNLVIPYDGYAEYSAVRGTTAQLNIAKADLLPITAPSHGGLSFGLHPGLPELQRIYQSGKLAVLCNVGTLAQPLTRTQFRAGGLVPDQLFSHADQVGASQSATASGQDPFARTGWGGRLADSLTVGYGGGALPMLVTTDGNALFTLGKTTQPFQPGSRLAGFPNPPGANPRYLALRRILAQQTGSRLANAANGGVLGALAPTDAFNAAINPPPTINTAFPQTDLGRDLFAVAQIIAARGALGMRRQVFFVSIGGFDTHTDQLRTQGSAARADSDLLLQVSQALGAFYAATEELGVADQVTSFTMSDFGRTFLPAAGANPGSDHAWGSHHFVLGGAVKGGDFYGKFPTLKLGGPDDASDEGRWIPTTGIDQYGATLAAWMGVDPATLPATFPRLGNFATPNLGFMAA